MPGMLVFPWLGQPQQHTQMGLPMQLSILMPDLLTCSAMGLSRRAWPAAGAAGLPAPPSLQPPPMLSCAALPRTACAHPFSAHHIMSGPVGRMMHPCRPYRVISTSPLLLLPARQSARPLCTGMPFSITTGVVLRICS